MYSMYRKDEKDYEIRIFLEKHLEIFDYIDNNIISLCIKEHNVSFYNVEQILMSLIEDDVIKEHENKYLKIQ